MIKGIRPRLAEAGKIKIGKKGPPQVSKTTGKNYYPAVKLDHFLVTTTQRGPDENFILNSQVMEALTKPRGEGGHADPDGKVREIPILLLSDNIDDVFPTSYAKWNGQQKHCEGDGEKATRYELGKNDQGYVERTGEEKEIPCPCSFSLGEKPSCRACGTLHCAINIPGIATIGSVFLWRTKSIISIEEMIGALLDIQARCGVLQNLPLLLRVAPKKTRRGTVQCCHIAMTANNVLEVMRQALEIRSMMGSLRSAEVPSYRAIAGASEEERDYDEADDDDGYIDTEAVSAETSAPEQPIAKDNPLYLNLTEIFVDLIKRRNIVGQQHQGERDEFWRTHCQEAIGVVLTETPTETQANKLIAHLRKVLSAPPAEAPPVEEQGLPGVA